jgi:hypothetical protein
MEILLAAAACQLMLRRFVAIKALMLQLKLPAAWCVSVMLEMRRSHRRTSAEQP